jgi:hypothetical protein
MLSIARCSLNEPPRGTSLFYFILFYLKLHPTRAKAGRWGFKKKKNVFVKRICRCLAMRT